MNYHCEIKPKDSTLLTLLGKSVVNIALGWLSHSLSPNHSQKYHMITYIKTAVYNSKSIHPMNTDLLGKLNILPINSRTCKIMRYGQWKFHGF